MRAKNAQHVKADGTITEVKPKEGDNFSLKELQGFVGGLIEIWPTKDGRTMVFNEEGLLLKLPINKKASELFGKGVNIVGDVLVCDKIK